MTGFIGLILRQRSAVLLLAILLLAAGVFVASSISLELFPNVSLGIVSVVTPYPGASPDAVLNNVTIPVENAVAHIAGVKEVDSTSYQNASAVALQFDYGTDLTQAQAQINAALSSVTLPSGASTPSVQKIDFSAFPILYYTLSGPSINATYQIAHDTIAPAIGQISGVAQVDVGGISVPVVNITLDPAKMQAHGVTAQAVSAALAANNVRLPAGTISANGKTLPVEVSNVPVSIADLRALPIGATPGGFAAGAASRFGGTVPTAGAAANSGAAPLVRLGDIATVELGIAAPGSQVSVNAAAGAPIVRAAGHPAVSLNVLKASDANIVKVASAVNAQMAAFEKEYPSIHVAVIQDASVPVKDSIAGLLREGLLGALFAVLVIFLFLRALRPTLVAAVSIPLSVVVALLAITVHGDTLNVMTLGGLAIAVGRVVDDAIVVLENIFRHAQQGDDRRTAVIAGTREVATAITGSTITTIAVFLPIAFIGGILGQFFAPFALTVTFALLASLLVSLTVVPALAGFMVGSVHHRDNDTAIQRLYTPILAGALASGRRKAAWLGGAAVLLVLSLGLIAPLPKAFFPNSNNNYAQMSVTLPPGTALATTTGLVDRLDVVLAHQPVRPIYEALVGYGQSAGGGGRSSTNTALFFLTYPTTVSIDTVVAQLRHDIAPLQNTTTTIVVNKSSSGPPTSQVQEQVQGTNQAGVAAAVSQIMAIMKQTAGLDNVHSDLSVSQQQIAVHVDAAKAMAYGLTPIAVLGQLSQVLNGQVVGQIHLGNSGQSTSMVLSLQPHGGQPTSLAALRGLPIAGVAGATTLGAIATITYQPGPVQILRVNQQQTVTVSADVVGTNQQAISQAVANQVAKMTVPAGVTVTTAGAFSQISDGFKNMGIALLIAVGLVYVIMVILFHSLLLPLSILFSLPLAVIGALGGLFITHRQLDVSALIGMLMLIGIVVTNAIVLLDLVERLRERGYAISEALVQAGRTRVRPILMTALATIMALGPLGLGFNEGTLIASNLATVVIGGLLTSTLLTLVIVPVVYSLIEGRRQRPPSQTPTSPPLVTERTAVGVVA